MSATNSSLDYWVSTWMSWSPIPARRSFAFTLGCSFYLVRSRCNAKFESFREFQIRKYRCRLGREPAGIECRRWRRKYDRRFRYHCCRDRGRFNWSNLMCRINVSSTGVTVLGNCYKVPKLLQTFVCEAFRNGSNRRKRCTLPRRHCRGHCRRWCRSDSRWCKTW